MASKYIYRGDSVFNGGNFILTPGQIFDGDHPAIAFGVGNIVPYGEDVVPEPTVDEDADDDVQFTEEYETGL